MFFSPRTHGIGIIGGKSHREEIERTLKRVLGDSYESILFVSGGVEQAFSKKGTKEEESRTLWLACEIPTEISVLGSRWPSGTVFLSDFVDEEQVRVSWSTGAEPAFVKLDDFAAAVSETLCTEESLIVAEREVEKLRAEKFAAGKLANDFERALASTTRGFAETNTAWFRRTTSLKQCLVFFVFTSAFLGAVIAWGVKSPSLASKALFAANEAIFGKECSASDTSKTNVKADGGSKENEVQKATEFLNGGKSPFSEKGDEDADVD